MIDFEAKLLAGEIEMHTVSLEEWKKKSYVEKVGLMGQLEATRVSVESKMTTHTLFFASLPRLHSNVLLGLPTLYSVVSSTFHLPRSRSTYLSFFSRPIYTFTEYGTPYLALTSSFGQFVHFI